jgi:hypothetical protein
MIVGILNITDKEMMLFLVASVTFLLSFQSLSFIIDSLTFGWEFGSAFFRLMNAFIAPAAAVVAIKAIYNVAKE